MILLDTHVVAWIACDPGQLSQNARQAIQQGRAEGGIAISAITLWELAMLMSRGRLEIGGTADVFVEEIASLFIILPITPKIAVLASQFPAGYSGDPSDRLIGATAMAEGLSLVTKDQKMRNCRLFRTIW